MRNETPRQGRTVATVAAYSAFGKKAEGSTAAEVMKNAGLDYDVKTEPLYTSSGKKVRSQFRRVYRTDNDDTLGVVGKNYKVLTNEEMFGVADTLVGDGLIEWDRVACLGHGERVLASFLLPDAFTIGKGDEIQQMVYLTNAHDGSAGFKVLPTNFRIGCSNQTAAIHAMLKAAGINPRLLTVRHTGKMQERIEDLRRVLHITDHFNEVFARQANDLLKVEVSAADRVTYYIDTLGLTTDENITTNAYGLSTRGLNTLEAILALEDKETNTTGGMGGTAWGMFNTLTEFIDHGWVHNADGSFNHKRAESALIGVGSRIKGKAWEGALLMA
jgi:phage/plasmid-like protein (TIGR03299 family)